MAPQAACTDDIRSDLGLFAGVAHIRNRLNEAPPPVGDEIDYDSLGWELAKAGRFQRDFTDPDYLAPYLEAGTAGELPRRQGPETVAYRPPLMPGLMAVSNLLLGRQFYAIRLVNMAAMAGVCALAVWTVSGIGGPVPALLVPIHFVLVDDRPRIYSRWVMTESLAALVAAMAAMFLIA